MPHDASVRNHAAVLFILLVLLAAGCGTPEKGGAPPTAKTSADWFSEQAQATGLNFVHVNGMSGERFIAEIIGPGVALVDYDNDGDLDVYAVQGQPLRRSPEQRAESEDRLFRNDLEIRPDGSRSLRFTDVTAQAGIVPRSYGMGVAAGDFNNDGWIDLYLGRFGADALLKNNGDGTFTDVFAKAGLVDPGWTVAVSFLDFDRDGWLDLFVSNYVQYSTMSDITCVAPSGARDYCSPQSYPPARGKLFRNKRDGTFHDVTVTSGIAREHGPALGTLAFDANGDGWIDVYVANDGADNQLWTNRRNGTFENTAVVAGVAVNGQGTAEGSMGVDAGDFDNDGDEDLVIANLTGEGSTLYANDGTGSFEDVAAATGLRIQTLAYTGFGTAWFDADNDGWLDILTVNGAVRTIPALAAAGDPFPLHQRKQLLRNTGMGRFEDATALAGAAFAASEVGRGAAFGDIDNDGDVDVVVANNNGRMRLLMNNQTAGNRWLGVRAVGASGRDMLGAMVGVVLSDGSVRWRRIRADGSYGSANDPRVVFGLGASGKPARIQVRWPSGRKDEWPLTMVNRWAVVREGAGVQ
jgi:enediyne biosynthesis protein E4